MVEPFAKLPKAIMERRDITAAGKLVYAAIADRIGRNVSAWPGMRKIASDIGGDVKTALCGIKQLEAAGLLTVEGQGLGRANHYKIQTVGNTGTESVGKNGALKKMERSENSPCGVGKNGTEALQFSEHNQTDPLNETQNKKSQAKQKPAKPDPWELALSFMQNGVLKNDQFKTVWLEWVADRCERRKTLTTRAVKKQIKGLEKMGIEAAIEAIDAAICHGWTGVVFPKKHGDINDEKNRSKLNRDADFRRRLATANR